MAELHREKDATRFDTEKLQKISFDGLTCAQVEAYFAEAIKEGKVHDEEDDEVEKSSATKEKKNKDDAKKEKKKSKEEKAMNGEEAEMPSKKAVISEEAARCVDDTVRTSNHKENVVDFGPANPIDDSVEASQDDHATAIIDRSFIKFWRPTAVFGVLLGAGCLFLMSRSSGRGLMRR